MVRPQGGALRYISGYISEFAGSCSRELESAQAEACATKTKTAAIGCRFLEISLALRIPHFENWCKRQIGLQFAGFALAMAQPGYLLERANWLPSGSLKTLEEPHSSFLGSVVNWTPLDLRILAVAKTSSHQKAMD
jgi:hypothetical protein